MPVQDHARVNQCFKGLKGPNQVQTCLPCSEKTFLGCLCTALSAIGLCDCEAATPVKDENDKTIRVLLAHENPGYPYM